MVEITEKILDYMKFSNFTFVLTHFSRMEFPTINNLNSPFLSKGCWVVFSFLFKF